MSSQQIDFGVNNVNESSVEELDVLRRRVRLLESENVLLAHNRHQADMIFHDIADNIQSVVSVVDASFEHQVYVSPGYKTLWERSLDSLYARPLSWLEAIHPEELSRVRTALEEPEIFNEEFRILRSDGDHRWVRTRFTPVRNENSQIVRYIAFTEDITDWKRMESQLIQSQKMDAVGRLAGGIAHDFNNLLTVINGYSAMLIERFDLADDVREDLTSICKAGERAAALTAQLLAFSRKAMTRPKILVLSEAIADIEPMLRRLIRENVELITTSSDETACVRADSTQFEQVIMNLVINARDAIEASGIITIETGKVHFNAETSRLHAQTKPGDYGVIAVSDNGRGMSASTQEHIFEPFFTTKESRHGTGLGLATVYGIVKQTGGTISVYSEEGVGTTFRIYVPLADGPDVKEPQEQLEQSALGSGTVLLVEDDEQVRHVAAEVLHKRGYTVTQAANGEDAARAAADIASIDLLVTDVIMPKMGGRELAAGLATLHPHMQVLFISGYTENAVVHLGNLSAKLNHLAKPFSPAALARKVGDILGPKPNLS